LQRHLLFTIASILGAKLLQFELKTKFNTNKTHFSCISVIFLYLLNLLTKREGGKPQIHVFPAKGRKESFKEQNSVFADRSNISGRTLQDITAPAKKYLGARQNLTTCLISPCYMPSQSLFPRGIPPLSLSIK